MQLKLMPDISIKNNHIRQVLAISDNFNTHIFDLADNFLPPHLFNTYISRIFVRTKYYCDGYKTHYKA